MNNKRIIIGNNQGNVTLFVECCVCSIYAEELIRKHLNEPMYDKSYFTAITRLGKSELYYVQPLKHGMCEMIRVADINPIELIDIVANL